MFTGSERPHLRGEVRTIEIFNVNFSEILEGILPILGVTSMKREVYSTRLPYIDSHATYILDLLLEITQYKVNIKCLKPQKPMVT